ncbi:MAG: hypothetical protein A2Z57_06190 [Planctomycetes bacterium RIFCSPHIGHO2_12_39_6]|nr:MAG: hypothetical protein A2Z57_06190 [Planctomycetes bacterium RIFCSPHIGHO2_12_39_6]
MIKIKNVIHTLEDIANRYGLKILSLDFTDITLISRIGFSFEIFIQIYANVKKEKVNMALVVADERIYGIDKEGGTYHEHPIKNPILHIPTEQIEIENFVIKSLEILKTMNLI